MKLTAPLDADGSIKISVGLLARLVSRWIWMVANARAVIDFHSVVVFVPHARPAKRNINFAPVYAYVLRPSGDIPCSELFASLRQDPDDREWPVEDGESYAISNKCVLTSQVAWQTRNSFYGG